MGSKALDEAKALLRQFKGAFSKSDLPACSSLLVKLKVSHCWPLAQPGAN